MNGNLKSLIKIVYHVLTILCLTALLYVSFIFIYKNISESVANGILEYVKALAWPVVVFILAFLFKSDISGFIRRMIRGKHPWLGEWEMSPASNQEEGNVSREVQPEGDAFGQIVAQKEAAISALQSNMTELKNSLTKAQVELDFERIYNFIFANQIELLNQINNLGGEVAFTYVAEHFVRLQQIFFGLNGWNPAKYLEFLVNNQLVEYKTAVGNFFSVALTLKGRAFISYVTARSYKKYGL